jgi:CheY-like chemotaxis protein
MRRLIHARGPKVAAFIREIKDRRRRAHEEHLALQAHLVRAQQLESLGMLAGGVAHDMNNVLAAILGLASIHAESAPAGTPLARAMATIVKACNRGRDVVKGILFFSRHNLEKVSAVSLNAVARDVSQLLRYTTLRKINLKLNLAMPLPIIQADEVAVAHALMNLCVNAVDAMPYGGSLLIRTGIDPRGRVELEVRDSGDGMSPDVLQRAMEPFFTTKAPGKGTGLGLSMVYGTMRAHGGDLVLWSRPGVGTRALLRFPAPVAAEPEAAPESAPAIRREARVSLSVLLVDDDPLILSSTQELLESLGHRVEAVGNGLEALAWLEAGHEADLILLDMNMPVLPGSQALPRILGIRPDQKVLVVSGYLDAEARKLVQAFPGVLAIEKPYSSAEFNRAISTLFASNPSTGLASVDAP